MVEVNKMKELEKFIYYLMYEVDYDKNKQNTNK